MATGSEIPNFAMVKYMREKLEDKIAKVAGMAGVDSWADVQTVVRQGLASRVFSIGDQLTCQRGGVNLVWDIIGIDHDTPADPQYTHSMTLQLHDCLSTPMQFDAREAFYCAESALPAGTYHFKVGDHRWVSGDIDRYFQFTTAVQIPAGGHIVFNQNLDVSLDGSTVSTYSGGTSAVPLETVTLSEGSAGNSLGTLGNAIQNGFNTMQRALVGSNRYKESAIRQWLNSSAAAGSVWTPQSHFDRLPSWAADAAGFLSGMDSDFAAVLGNVTKVTAKNTVSDGGGYDTTSEKIFLLSRSEVYGGEENGVNEGAAYPYYAGHSDLSGAGIDPDAGRVKQSGSSAVNWWLRSVNPSFASHAREVLPDGGIYSIHVHLNYYVAPACCVV